MLIEKLQKIAKANNLNMAITEKNIPDRKWLVLVLGHLNPKDEIFQKDYVPPPLRKRKDQPKVIQYPNGFFKHLSTTLTTKKKSRSRLQILKTGKAIVKELRMKEKKDLLRVELELEKSKRV